MNAFCLRPLLAAKYRIIEAKIIMLAVDCDVVNPNIYLFIYILSTYFQ